MLILDVNVARVWQILNVLIRPLTLMKKLEALGSEVPMSLKISAGPCGVEEWGHVGRHKMTGLTAGYVQEEAGGCARGYVQGCLSQ